MKPRVCERRFLRHGHDNFGNGSREARVANTSAQLVPFTQRDKDRRSYAVLPFPRNKGWLASSDHGLETVAGKREKGCLLTLPGKIIHPCGTVRLE